MGKKFSTRTNFDFYLINLFWEIFQASEELEDRESLAVMAANSAENSGSLNHIEQYSRGVSAVETILSLDHLRQKVAVKELLQRAKHKNPLPLPPAVAGSAESAQFMRKTVSVPNFSQVSPFSSPFSLFCIGLSAAKPDYIHVLRYHTSLARIITTT